MPAVNGNDELDLNVSAEITLLFLPRSRNLPIGRDNVSSFVTRLSNIVTRATREEIMPRLSVAFNARETDEQSSLTTHRNVD